MPHPERGPEIDQEQLAKLEEFKRRLAPFLGELPGLKPYVRENEDSEDAKRYSDIQDLRSAVEYWLYYLGKHGKLPENPGPEKIFSDPEEGLKKP